MKAFADANIYVLANLNQDFIWAKSNDGQWNTSGFDQFTRAIDLLSPYTNTLGFVISDPTLGNAKYWPFQKAAVRDAKQYMQNKRYRDIPVGFTIDGPDRLTGEELVLAEIDFMTCDQHRADLLAFMPSYGGNNCQLDDNAEPLKYGMPGKIYTRTQIPTFIAQYGCSTDRFNEKLDKRNYTIVQSFYNKGGSEVLSGAIAYEYFQRENPDYGKSK